MDIPSRDEGEEQFQGYMRTAPLKGLIVFAFLSGSKIQRVRK